MRAPRREFLAGCCATLALVSGCTPDFDEVWDVSDLRVLAVRADPPEVLVPIASLADIPERAPPVRIEALVVDPRAPDAEFDWTASVCSAEEDLCADAKVKPKEIQRGRSRLDQIAFEFVADRELILAAREADPFGGFGGIPILLELVIDDGELPVTAVKRLVYGAVDPPGKRPNQNPSLARIKRDDAVIDTDLGQLDPEQELTLLPEPTPETKEKYLVRTFELEARELEEFISYSFFTTGGTLSHARTGGKPSTFVTNKKVDDVTSDFTAPTASGPGKLWIVIRDDRGGVDWRELAFEVR